MEQRQRRPHLVEQNAVRAPFVAPEKQRFRRGIADSLPRRLRHNPQLFAGLSDRPYGFRRQPALPKADRVRAGGRKFGDTLRRGQKREDGRAAVLARIADVLGACLLYTSNSRRNC